MFDYVLPAADAVAILILTLALYYPRHRRRDLVLAYLAVNVGVLAVARALAETSVNVGLGLGLFGVLALIRLRSETLEQHEIAYYFSALALGLMGGLAGPMEWVAIGLMAAIVLVVALADAGAGALKPRKAPTQTVVLKEVFTDQTALRARLESLLGGSVVELTVKKLDLVAGQTVVDVRMGGTSGHAVAGPPQVGQPAVGQPAIGQPAVDLPTTGQEG
ncbi:MAG: DUF4956 domain-containing protein [Bifidobacteriaceae bacterium]|jgi:hypothetical protein|nr:DUF4956 domain-containing protein [Bifidobacteriaceae bacterium]